MSAADTISYKDAKFEAASGVAISDYNGQRIGEAVRMDEYRLRELAGIRDQARRLHEWFETEFAASPPQREGA